MSFAKKKGTGFETRIAKELQEASKVQSTRRQPGSGAIDGFKGDVVLDPRGWGLQIECKHRKQVAHYERLENRRGLSDVLLIENNEGTFAWLEHGFMLDLIAQAYGHGGVLINPRVATSNTPSAFGTFHDWLKDSHVLCLLLNNRKPRWFMEAPRFFEIVTFAARAEFKKHPKGDDYGNTLDGPLD